MLKVSSADLKANIGQIYDRMSETGEPIVVEDGERPVMALVSAEDYELLQRIEDAADRALIKQIKREGGDYLDSVEVKAELGI